MSNKIKYFMIRNEDGTYSYCNEKAELISRAEYNDLPARWKKRAISMAWGFNGGTCTVRSGRVVENQKNRITGETRTVYADSGRVYSR